MQFGNIMKGGTGQREERGTESREGEKSERGENERQRKRPPLRLFRL